MNVQEKWIKKEKIIVSRQCLRARKRGRLATLTLEEWLATLDYFDWKCAYCLEAPYESLDHFIPLDPGYSPLITMYGGTTANNCVPACKRCNSRKQCQSPEFIMKWYGRSDLYQPFPSKEEIKRIAEYLKIGLETP